MNSYNSYTWDIESRILEISLSFYCNSEVSNYFYYCSGLFSNKDEKDKTNIFPLTLCMELRVIKKSESLLCPASNTMWSEEHVVYIEVLSTPDTPGYQEYFRAIAKKWMDLGGIPHWQKQWAFLGDDHRFSDNKSLRIFEHIKKNFEKNLKAFDAIRKKYDSDCLFMNKTMARIFE